jgi:hypothetical protein
MRKPENLKSNLAVAFLTLIMLTGVTASQGSASNLSPPASETGYPGELINRPVCWSRPAPADIPHCGAVNPLRHGIRSSFD